MTSTPEFEILPKLLPQVIKAIVDLHELNGSTIEDIIDQVKTNMAFYGIRSTKKNVKTQVHLCLRHGVRLGCFRVESQGKFRINKLKYCVPVLKCVLSPHCVNSAIKSRYLLRHYSSDIQTQQNIIQQLPQQEHKQRQPQNQPIKDQQSPKQRNKQTKKLHLKKIYKRTSTRKTCSRTCSLRRPESTTAPLTTRSSGCIARSSNSSRSQQKLSPHVSGVISEMNNDLDKSILPFFRDPLTSYKKSSNTSVICIYDPAGHMGPQMECADNIKLNDDQRINVQDNIEKMAVTTDQSSTTIDMSRNSVIKSSVPTIQSSMVSTKVSLSTINSVSTTRDQCLNGVRKLKQSEGVLKRLQRKFDQLQRTIWGGKSSHNAVLTPNSKDESESIE